MATCYIHSSVKIKKCCRKINNWSKGDTCIGNIAAAGEYAGNKGAFEFLGIRPYFVSHNNLSPALAADNASVCFSD